MCHPSFLRSKSCTSTGQTGYGGFPLPHKAGISVLVRTGSRYSVENELGNVEAQLKSRFPEVVDEFERTAHELSVAFRKSQKLSYYQRNYEAEMQEIYPPSDPFGLLSSVKYGRRWRKLRSINLDNFFCPSFERWWTRREEADLSDWEGFYMLGNECFGFQRELRDISQRQLITAFVSFADE